jgi:hypothetical protein
MRQACKGQKFKGMLDTWTEEIVAERALQTQGHVAEQARPHKVVAKQAF